MSILKKEIVSLSRHALYPSTIIDIIRNYMKSSRENAFKNLPIFIELILKYLFSFNIKKNTN